MTGKKLAVGLLVSFAAIGPLRGAIIVHHTVELSQARKNPAEVATSSRAVFAGGRGLLGDSDRVDYYDIETGTWSTGTLPESINNQQAAATQDVAVFAGGTVRGGVRDFAFVFENAAGSFDFQHLSVPRHEHAAAAVGNKILFAGGWADERSDSVDSCFRDQERFPTRGMR